jgi:hypothetical protein
MSVCLFVCSFIWDICTCLHLVLLHLGLSFASLFVVFCFFVSFFLSLLV